MEPLTAEIMIDLFNKTDSDVLKYKSTREVAYRYAIDNYKLKQQLNDKRIVYYCPDCKKILDLDECVQEDGGDCLCPECMAIIDFMEVLNG